MNVNIGSVACVSDNILYFSIFITIVLENTMVLGKYDGSKFSKIKIYNDKFDCDIIEIGQNNEIYI